MEDLLNRLQYEHHTTSLHLPGFPVALHAPAQSRSRYSMLLVLLGDFRDTKLIPRKVTPLVCSVIVGLEQGFNLASHPFSKNLLCNPLCHT